MSEHQPGHQQAGRSRTTRSGESEYQGQQGTQQGMQGQQEWEQSGIQGQQAMQQPGLGTQQGYQPRAYQRVPSQEFGQSAPLEIQEAFLELDEFETVAEWAHTRAMERGNHQVGTITDHLAEIAHLEKRLILGRSPFTGTVAHCTEGSIQQGIEQLEPFSQDPVVREVLEHARYVGQTIARSLRQLHEWGEMQRVEQSIPKGRTGGQQPAGGRGGVQRQQY